ncbi:hypothetical protein [Rothia mucilaginosa]|uniref:hypothetical protein n=1 Tax=Rothia mucilaginosa TaxID=43675 RepID=UPI0026F29426|nr:hypothetical protein [Rothia mucilaginosa]
MMIRQKIAATGVAAVMLAAVAACSASTADSAPTGSPVVTASASVTASGAQSSTPEAVASTAQPSSASPVASSAAPTIIAALPSASRWGHYGAPGNVDVASDAAGWSPQEQKDATDFAVQTMRVFAMDTDAATWHQYMDPRVTDKYREQLARYNPAYTSVREVREAVYTEFPSDPTRAVVRVSTNDGIWVVQLYRSGPGEAPKVSNIAPLSAKRR